MEEALVTRLLAVAGLTALTATRIYWNLAPQNVAKPYVVLTRVTGIRDMKMSGPSGLVESRVQVDCYGATYASAKGVALQAETALSGYKGTVSTTIFDGCFLVMERHGYVPDDTPDRLHRISLDFIIWHKGV